MDKKRFWINLGILLILIIPILFLGSFVDEQENIVAGWFMTKGLVPYKDFFFHHAPLPFFISWIFMFLFGMGKLWVYRVFMVLVMMTVFFILLAKFKRNSMFISALIILVSVSTPVFSTNFFLADSIISVMFLLMLGLGMYWAKKTALNDLDLLIAGMIVSSIILWSSIAYFPSILILMLGFFVGRIKNFNFKTLKTNICSRKKIIVGIGLINFALVIYFVINKAWNDLIWSVFTYNQQYYFPYRLADGEIERMRGFVFRVFHQFWLYLFRNIKLIFDSVWVFGLTIKAIFLTVISKPIGISFGLLRVALSSLLEVWLNYELISVLVLFVTFIWILRRRKIIEALLFVFFAIFLRVRSNEVFHLGPFYSLIFVCMSWLASRVWNSKKMVLNGFAATLFVLMVGSFVLPYKNMLSKSSGIIKPEDALLAQMVAVKSANQDQVLVVGGNPIYYALSNRLPASKYHYYHPWFVPAPQIRDTIVDSVKSKDPKLIILGDYSAESAYFDPELVELIKIKYKQSTQSEKIYEHK